MSTVKRKSPEEIQAQVAAYASEFGEASPERRHLFDNIGKLALSDTPQELGALGSLSLTGEDYLAFLRPRGGSDRELIHRRANLLERYEEFRPAISGLIDNLKHTESDSETLPLLGSGCRSSVYRLSKSDKQYAIRMAKREEEGMVVPPEERSRPSMIDRHITGALAGDGIPRLEKIVAASYEDGVTIAEIMPGKPMDVRMSVQDVLSITDRQIEELADTLIATHDAGIEIDSASSANFLYDRDKGFGIIDYYASEKNKRGRGRSLGDTVSCVSDVLMNAGIGGKQDLDMTTDDFQKDAVQLSANMGVLQRYRIVVCEKVDGEELEIALEGIDMLIELYQEIIENYSDPTWVAEAIKARSSRSALSSQMSVR